MRGRTVVEPIAWVAQEPFRGMLITSRLDQDVEHDAVLVDGSPQPVAMTTNTVRYFVEMPFVAGSSTTTTKLMGEGGSELDAPATNGLIADRDAAFRQESSTSRKLRWKR